MEEVAFGQRAASAAIDRAYAGARELSARKRVEIGMPFHVRAHVCAHFRTHLSMLDEALCRARIRIAESGKHVASYLERARPDRWSEPCQHGRGLDAHRRNRRFDHASREPAPACMR